MVSGSADLGASASVCSFNPEGWRAPSACIGLTSSSPEGAAAGAASAGASTGASLGLTFVAMLRNIIGDKTPRPGTAARPHTSNGGCARNKATSEAAYRVAAYKTSMTNTPTPEEKKAPINDSRGGRCSRGGIL